MVGHVIANHLVSQVEPHHVALVVSQGQWDNNLLLL